MVLAEKIVAALERRTLSTRWRDCVDIAALATTRPVTSEDLLDSLHAVAQHRAIPMVPLRSCLGGYADSAQARWLDWRRRHHVEDRTPEAFGDLLGDVIAFADPVLDGGTRGWTWSPGVRAWP